MDSSFLASGSGLLRRADRRRFEPVRFGVLFLQHADGSLLLFEFIRDVVVSPVFTAAFNVNSVLLYLGRSMLSGVFFFSHGSGGGERGSEPRVGSHNLYN